MSDKLKDTIPVVAQFVDGEAARAAKLNIAGLQLQNSARILEAAAGDLYGESWPYSADTDSRMTLKVQARGSATDLSGTTDRFLDVTSLGRLIGPASRLNPRMLGRKLVTQTIPSGVTEFQLQYLPELPGTFTLGSAGSAFITQVYSQAELDEGGLWYVDTKGRVFTVIATTGGTIQYYTDPTEYYGGMSPQGATFNTIPDIQQVHTGAGCTVSGPDGEGRYSITLPTVTHHQSNHAGNSVTLGTIDPTTGLQLTLPRIFTDNLLTGEVIPSGMIYLKDWTGNEIYLDGVYTYNSSTTLYVSGVDLDAGIAASNKYYLITVGSDITSAIDDLRVKSFASHDRTYGEPLVEIENLVGFLRYRGASGPYVKSDKPGNFAPQYLHRDGFTLEQDENLNFGNAMRGNLVLGSSNTLGSAVHASGALEPDEYSFGVIFGMNGVGVSDQVLQNSTHIRMSENKLTFRHHEHSNQKYLQAVGDDPGFQFNGVVRIATGDGGPAGFLGEISSVGETASLSTVDPVITGKAYPVMMMAIYGTVNNGPFGQDSFTIELPDWDSDYFITGVIGTVNDDDTAPVANVSTDMTLAQANGGMGIQWQASSNAIILYIGDDVDADTDVSYGLTIFYVRKA